MTVRELIDTLHLKPLSCCRSLDCEITGGYACDLHSDVLAHARKGMVWITIRANRNTIAVASFKELSAVVLAGDVEMDAETLALAESEGVAVLSTDMQTFEAVGRIRQLLVAADL